MAIYECEVNRPFDEIIKRIEEGIIDGSISATVEDKSDFVEGDARCSVRVFERYSYLGQNRVSLSVTFFQVGTGPVKISAITSGGSQGMFYKINTIGENTFLDKFRELI